MQRKSIISDGPPVTILMGVYNGAAFLPEQLESIAAQSHQNWHLVCRDDQSTDNSQALLRAFARENLRKVTIKNGPNLGFSANFMSLIKDTSHGSTYLCFADQDDVWKPGKIARALAVLKNVGTNPHLYCGRRSYWFPSRKHAISSPQMRRSFTLQNALVENIASGNTIMLNPAATVLAQQAAHRTGDVFAHDWWLYLLITAAGGAVTFDNGPPSIQYRQHDKNLIGAGTSITEQIRRKTGVLQGTFANRVAANLNALASIEDLLTNDARLLYKRFAAARDAQFFRRLSELQRIGPYRQRKRDTIGFWGAACLGCI